MKTAIKWREVKNSLRAEHKTAPHPRPANEFWQAFEAHARLHPQQIPSSVATNHRGNRFWHMPFNWVALSGATASVLIALSGFFWLYLNNANANTYSTVKSYQVGVNHSAVVLLTDQAEQATILWVSGMDVAEKEREP
jgi:hypothetical protein